VREMVKEFWVDVYGYDPLLSKEEIESFDVKALDFSFSTGFLFCKKKKCVDVRAMFDGEEGKGFIIRGFKGF